MALKTARIEEIQEQIIISFANIIAEIRDTITGEHVRRTSLYAENCDRAAPKWQLSGAR